MLLGFVARLLSPVLSLVLRLRQPELERFMRIDRLASEAYSKGQWTGAETLAREGLALAEHYSSNWNYGNVIHNCHQILGLLRLREGKREEAIQMLLTAGRTPGSPQLDSFGPRIVLARELLKVGERESVLQYIELVALFWTKKSAQFPEVGLENKRSIMQWKTDVEAGKLPQHKRWTADI